MTEVEERVRPTDRAELRRELEGSVREIVLEPTDGGVAFRGRASYGPMLEGPPRKLHGGLHAYARLFPLLPRIAEHPPERTYPCRLTLGLGQPIHLDTEIPFDGRYLADASAYRLEVRHAESAKLEATLASTVLAADPIARFRDAHSRTRVEEPLARVTAERDLPMSVHTDLLLVEADRKTRERCVSLSAYLTERDTVDAVLVCVLLDVVGAVVLAWETQGHCYTLRMDLTIHQAEIPAEVDLVALGLRETSPDEGVRARPVEVAGRSFGPTAVDVLLADAALTTPYASGRITVLPARSF